MKFYCKIVYFLIIIWILTLQQSFGRLAEGQTVVAGVRTGCQGWPDHIGRTQDQLHQEQGSHRSASNDTRPSQS